MTAFEWFSVYLDECGSVQVGTLWQCPAHDDSYPSLAVSEGEGGSVLLFCHGGCEFEAVMEALYLQKKAAFEPHVWSPKKYLEQLPEKPYFDDFAWRSGTSSSYDYRMKWSNSPIEVTYHYYTDTVRMKRMRFSDGRKSCPWESKVLGKWVQGGLSGKLGELPLYRFAEIESAIEIGAEIVLCESESSVDALIEAGIPSTTWAGGAGKPQIVTLKVSLANAKVLYIADNDIAGIRCEALLSQKLGPYVERWEILKGNPGEDARDLLMNGQLHSLIVNHN